MTVSTGSKHKEKLTFLRDSFLASFTESLNILSRMSRFSVRYSIRWSVQHSLRSHWIFGGCGSGLASGLTASVLEAWEQHLWGGAEVSSGSFHLGGMEQVTETETEVVKWLWWDGVWKDSRNGERGRRGKGDRAVRGWKELYSWGSQTYHMVTLSLGAAQLSSKVRVGASEPQLGQGLKCKFGSSFVRSFLLWTYLGNVILDSFYLSLANCETPIASPKTEVSISWHNHSGIFYGNSPHSFHLPRVSLWTSSGA